MKYEWLHGDGHWASGGARAAMQHYWLSPERRLDTLINRSDGQKPDDPHSLDNTATLWSIKSDTIVSPTLLAGTWDLSLSSLYGCPSVAAPAVDFMHFFCVKKIVQDVILIEKNK